MVVGDIGVADLAPALRKAECKDVQHHRTSRNELDEMRALVARDLADADVEGLSADRSMRPPTMRRYEAANQVAAGRPSARRTLNARQTRRLEWRAGAWPGVISCRSMTTRVTATVALSARMMMGESRFCRPGPPHTRMERAPLIRILRCSSSP
jgi:hypothetical protein